MCSHQRKVSTDFASGRFALANLNGSVNLRLLLSESITSGTSAVPFYFQQTLGGADIDGAPSLSSYQDYRFRAPNVLLLQEDFEHSIWGPFGFRFMADQGRVALTRGRHRIRSSETQLCQRTYSSSRWFSHGLHHVRMGRK